MTRFTGVVSWTIPSSALPEAARLLTICAGGDTCGNTRGGPRDSDRLYRSEHCCMVSSATMSNAPMSNAPMSHVTGAASDLVGTHASTDARPPSVLQFTGRLDNRDAIARACGLRLSERTPDADLVRAAFERWGDALCTHLIGDFALAIWEPAARRLHLARDPFGACPLYVAQPGSALLWSTDLDTLVRLARCGTDRLDEAFVAAYLTTPDIERTPYPELRPVPPGVVITAEAQGTRPRRYWRPDPSRTVRHATDRGYEEEFLAIFTDGVAARLRSDQPVMTEVSGGLDSSSIACVAAPLVSRRQVSAPSLAAVTYVFADSPSSNESRYLEAVEQQTGLRARRIEGGDMLTDLEAAGAFSRPNPGILFKQQVMRLGACMQEAGAARLLSGIGGDHLLTHMFIYPRLADLLREGRLRTLARELHGLHHQWKSAYSTLLWSSMIWPLLPVSWRARLRSHSLSEQDAPPWLDRQFARRTHARERWLGLTDDGGYTRRADQWAWRLVTDAIGHSASCFHADWTAIDVTYPYLHRPLVEFLLAIPSDQKLRPGEMRSIQRRALTGILPELVRTRQSKTSHGEAVCRALARAWPRLRAFTADLRIAERGYVDAVRFREELARARYGISDYIQPLCKALVLEAWLRGGGAGLAPTR